MIVQDTYNKVKKKIYVDENGVTITPKWRFYHSMLFIDQDAPKDLQNERPHPTDFGGGASEQDNNKRLNSVGNKRPAPERSSLDDSSIPQKVCFSHFDKSCGFNNVLMSGYFQNRLCVSNRDIRILQKGIGHLW